jgi:hypothetical protein
MLSYNDQQMTGKAKNFDTITVISNVWIRWTRTVKGTPKVHARRKHILFLFDSSQNLPGQSLEKGGTFMTIISK